MSTRVRSFSKINLGLRVGPPQVGTGFHALRTCYQTLAACDFITVSAKAASTTKITLAANHPGVPRTETGDAEKNTAYRLVALALESLGVTAEVHIELDKRMPVQGGLGAGSANAAAALIALERELGQSLSWDDRLRLAADVGSDVPMFLVGGTMLGVNRGEEVYPLPDLPETPCVLAIPDVGVSTKLAFEAIDEEYARAAGARGQAQGAGPRRRVPLRRKIWRFLGRLQVLEAPRHPLNPGPWNLDP
ncbi:4-(cytidine 5'-diphospho)-2-C-methyl-D-erythritol kinase [Granulicella cerasi]|uniref:4-(Cytidine 5'-diphospho)-2-C-methyl-D-erythritol kinase n=1 Tax=Granulicella cerasi TaxID=741063 RepID=A0ABW1ZCJ8_9BACT